MGEKQIRRNFAGLHFTTANGMVLLADNDLIQATAT